MYMPSSVLTIFAFSSCAPLTLNKGFVMKFNNYGRITTVREVVCKKCARFFHALFQEFRPINEVSLILSIDVIFDMLHHIADLVGLPDFTVIVVTFANTLLLLFHLTIAKKK